MLKKTSFCLLALLWVVASDSVPLTIPQTVVSVSRRQGIDPLLILAMIEVESNFRAEIRSNKGALGLLQIRPIALKEIGEETVNPTNLLEPSFNIDVGVRYLNYLLKHYRHDLEKALTAYNLGPTELNRRVAVGDPLPLQYYQKVMQAYEALRVKIPPREALADLPLSSL